MKYSIAIDNGVTGHICVLDEQGNVMFYGPTPVRKCLNYTKAKEFLNRVDGIALRKILEPYSTNCTLVIERPLVNPGRWKATVSALRCDEATLIILEALGIRYQYIDSNEWQKPMLPNRSAPPGRAQKGASEQEKAELKKKRAAYQKETKVLSLAVGQRLFPGVEFKKDADAAIMAEWCRREKL